jgi:GPH family glycoside/pentoside/hexuronide:cation symporter
VATPHPPNGRAASLRETLPLASKLLFGAPSFAGAAMVIPIAIHMTKFYADVVLVPLGVLGIAIALARAFDALTDPLVGWLSDRTRSRLGRRRPWLLAGGPLCGVAFWFLFSPPAHLDPAGGATWFFACYLAYFLFHTFYLIPYIALGAELTLDYHDRTSLFGIREGFVIVGTLCAAVLPSLLTERLGEREALSAFAGGFGLLLGLSYLLLVSRVRERPEFSRRRTSPFVPGVRRALRNGPFRILLAKALLTGVPGTLNGTLLPFFNEYVVQPDHPARWLMFQLATYFGSAFLFLPPWLVVSRRIGKKNAMLAVLAIGIVGTGAVLAVGHGDVWLLLGLLALNGSTFGAISFLTPAMKADVIDHDELHTGQRREAQYTSLWAILPKFVQIPAAAVPIALLGSLGYVPNQPQNETVIWTLRLLMAIVPAASFAGAFLVTRHFPIDPEVHHRIQLGLDAHARGEATEDPVTGRVLPPPGGHGRDDDTAWYLDHFSEGELRRAARGGPRRLVFDVALAGVAALALSAVSATAVWGTITSLDVKPGAGSVVGVVVAGLAFCGFVFHALRLGAALRFGRRGLDAAALDRHRAGI